MKMTHDCYMPKEAAAEGSGPPPQKQSKQTAAAASAQQKEPDQNKHKDSNDTQSGKQASSIRVDNVMSQFNAQIADAAQHIKIEVSDWRNKNIVVLQQQATKTTNNNM